MRRLLTITLIILATLLLLTACGSPERSVRRTYRLHLSVVRNNQVTFRAVVTQNVALRTTPRGWRIMGGDQPQLSEVAGRVPSGEPSVHR